MTILRVPHGVTVERQNSDFPEGVVSAVQRCPVGASVPVRLIGLFTLRRRCDGWATRPFGNNYDEGTAGARCLEVLSLN